MSSETYEIIELSNGDVALRRAGHKDDPLVRIHFSAESLEFLREHKVTIARAMLEAGIEAVQEINDLEPEPFEEEEVDITEHTIH
ncbi:hypothetical protein [Microbulbifer hydrolyticus]|uniref:Uncharacterized protein n=1 Tax=Microbulbifer hydrolyticus TaxID=48074 RepID=A0A6P1TBK0_9GAMM|nr:hypothetical protein [Microbulbifer hydrolyticus]MBB5210573.1 hypothetical protein [Microbulbifer hydrolyticus]QHQ38960.1 hypothetical protein GTQ55_08165 [Microbulbifer hydrolyticus]